MQRRDNRLLFARQTPASRGRFMQQVELSQVSDRVANKLTINAAAS